MERIGLATIDQVTLVVREESEKIKDQMHYDHDKITTVMSGDFEKQIEKVTIRVDQYAKDDRYRQEKTSLRFEKLQSAVSAAALSLDALSKVSTESNARLEAMKATLNANAVMLESLTKVSAESNQRLEAMKASIMKIIWIVTSISAAVSAGAVAISGTM